MAWPDRCVAAYVSDAHKRAFIICCKKQSQAFPSVVSCKSAPSNDTQVSCQISCSRTTRPPWHAALSPSNTHAYFSCLHQTCLILLLERYAFPSCRSYMASRRCSGTWDHHGQGHHGQQERRSHFFVFLARPRRCGEQHAYYTAPPPVGGESPVEAKQAKPLQIFRIKTRGKTSS